MLLQTIVASIIGSVFALWGGLILLWREALARKISLFLVSFAAGALMGAAFFELIPEAISSSTSLTAGGSTSLTAGGSTSLTAGEAGYEAIAPFVILGILIIFIFEKTLNWYHCHDQEKCDYHSFSSAVLFGDAVHNFIDGIVIAFSFSVGVPAGIATTVAVFFHEVPQEIGDFGVLLHAGYARSKVFFYNFLTALTTPAGAIFGYILLPWISGFVPPLLAFAAGSFIYIAASDLLPELRHEGRGVEAGHILSIILGIAAIWVVGVVLPE